MFLKDNYHKVVSVEKSGESEGTVRLELLGDCDVYQGHFPGKPVCPGVCNMETIKECACLVLGKDDLRYESIKMCRLTAVATPEVCPEIEVKVRLDRKDNGYVVQGVVCDARQTYMELKGIVA